MIPAISGSAYAVVSKAAAAACFKIYSIACAVYYCIIVYRAAGERTCGIAAVNIYSITCPVYEVVCDAHVFAFYPDAGISPVLGSADEIAVNSTVAWHGGPPGTGHEYGDSTPLYPVVGNIGVPIGPVYNVNPESLPVVVKGVVVYPVVANIIHH